MNIETTERPATSTRAFENEDQPIIPRMYEVQSALELENQDSTEIKQDPELNSEHVMPFIGQIIEHTPGEKIVIERILHLEEDLYLADHAFVYAPGIKPLSSCKPVLPMTFSLEVMAEIAACLVPGFGLIGLEDIKATRWIELADTNKLALNITARKLSLDPVQQIYRIEASIYINGQKMPAISAKVLFASNYQLDLAVGFSQLIEVKRLQANQIYQERHMFHGPLLQCLVGEIILGDHGAIAELITSHSEKLFRTMTNPQLMLDPGLLDGIGQLIGVWTREQRARTAFPIGFKKLELYQPTPPPGTSVPVRIEITRDETMSLYASIEIQDGSGSVWMRIHDWGMWKFHWPQKLLDFSRRPTHYLVSDPVSLPSLTSATICQILSSKDIKGFDIELLARFYLQEDEFSEFASKASVSKRQHQWLLGRIVAKDAIRAWIVSQTNSEEMMHPAAFNIVNDDKGQPLVRGLSLEIPTPKISIAHCEDRAIAITESGPVGVDIERISTRIPGFLETISSETERVLLSEKINIETSADQMDEWTTRLWCAKEVVGKLMGTGVVAPQNFEATEISTDGIIQIRPRGSDRPVIVCTIRDTNFIIAHAIRRTPTIVSDAPMTGE